MQVNCRIRVKPFSGYLSISLALKQTHRFKEEPLAALVLDTPCVGSKRHVTHSPTAEQLFRL
ncbi:hypothetical protein PC123_g22661, partial [Phytophthora cactorum]